MLMKKLTLLSIMVLLVLSYTSSAQNKIILHNDMAKDVISKEIYGHFAEHLGHCIYGGIYVGENSTIKNQNGYRTDVVDALKAMKIPLLRWPGGCFADTYHWKDGIGPKANRPSIVNVHWGGVTEDNSFGTHEFLNFCELIGAEAYVSLNLGSGTVREASEWVEYITSSNESPMTKLRKENGREDPWNVKYFGIGNETWGCGGNMTPDYYADVYKQFATFCGGAKYKIACGPPGDDYNWTEVFMNKLKNFKGLAQGLALHHYTITENWTYKGSATQFAEKDWFTTLKNTLYMDELVTRHGTIMDKYDPDKAVGLIVDEWGNWFEVEPGTNPGFLFQQNTLRDALVAGINLNIFNNHADRIKMTNIAQMVNVLQAVILTKDDKMVLTPTYYVFKMYSVHQGATSIPMNLTSEKYELNGQSIPAINASASVKDGVVSITLCNLNPNKAVSIDIDLGDDTLKNAKGQYLTAKNINDYNDFDQAEKVTVKDIEVKKPANGKMKIELPAKSVMLVQLTK
jgi:alpha-L-arabinofuranosidase